MGDSTWSKRLWGNNAKTGYLWVAAGVLLFSFLGARDLWTQEHRWADIVSAMIYSHDYLHPSLNGVDYYDKPLLSYWIMVALSLIKGKLTLWVLRLPSALAGCVTILALYRLGVLLKDRQLGLVAGWLLLTTFYFVFWARTSSADMLNLAGTVLGVSWYAAKKEQPTFMSHLIFFLILAVTALCKGLVGPVVTMLVILPDWIAQRRFSHYLNGRVIGSVMIAMMPAIMVYMLPFWVSTHFQSTGYSENGLYLVYKENILRYFHPFDHQDPIYTYFIFLPVYLFPWIVFFIPAVGALLYHWRRLSWNTQWMAWAVFILFLFFTLSGSRRSYYVLPIVPFAILVTANWIVSGVSLCSRRFLWAGRMTVVFFSALLLYLSVLQPLFYSKGLYLFASTLQAVATQIKPWSKWHIVMLDAESKVRFYLQVPPDVRMYQVKGLRDKQTHESLLSTWDVLKHKPNDTIFVTRFGYVPLLRNEFKHYRMIYIKQSENAPVAFIPTAS